MENQSSTSGGTQPTSNPNPYLVAEATRRVRSLWRGVNTRAAVKAAGYRRKADFSQRLIELLVATDNPLYPESFVAPTADELAVVRLLRILQHNYW